MLTEEQALQIITQQGMLPLFYHSNKNVCIEIVKALYEAGVRAIEFTNRGSNALENCKAIIALKNTELPDLAVGIGTIKAAREAHLFIQAGVDFLISPMFDAEVCDATYLEKILWVPGCMTPTEIHAAEKAGCKLVKLFPGNVLGPSFVKAIRELFPSMLFMPTGGVSLDKENIKSWFDAGVAAIGMGSQLISRELMEAEDYATIYANTKEALAMVQEIRK